jgi:hypothetical protein
VLLALAAIVVAIVLGIVIAASLQPSEFHVERSATMNASPQEVFAQVNDFHRWDAWSPWLELDPNAKTTYEGPSEGEGAIFRWAGNENVGEGSMTILESQPHERISIELHFIKPFEDTAITDFAFQPAGDGTKVTWSMDGKNNFVAKVFCLFMDMEEMIGGNYEEGLANMKRIVESPAAGEADALEATREENPSSS